MENSSGDTLPVMPVNFSIVGRFTGKRPEPMVLFGPGRSRLDNPQ
jgi:hypothetical protein